MPSAGITRLLAPNSGWISKQWVKDGQPVHQGQPLYALRLDNVTSDGSTGQRMIALLKDKRSVLENKIERQDALNREKKAALVAVRNDIEAEGKQIDSQIALATEHLQLLNEMAEKQKANLKRGFAKDSDYEPRLQSYMAQQAQLEQLRRDKAELQTRLQDTTSQLASFDLTAASDLSQTRQEIIDVEQGIADAQSKWEITVTAPRDGVVSAMIAHEGQSVSSGMPLLSVIPKGDALSAQLLVPSSAIGFIKPQQRVLLRYDSFPYQRFGQYLGTVAAISGSTMSADELRVAGLEVSDGEQRDQLYRVTVQPDLTGVEAYGKTMPLQPGMRLEASILTDTRPLYQWILDPLYSLTRTTVSRP
ncbi:HlyD family secretion protein [Oryzifoliimicrobium ureilyticus]|uniref:HlyD family secretion protein n=1 Tax=Oryzifoliimicrobium ureilyticus TaxID=3113724 RepID=UPI0030768176